MTLPLLAALGLGAAEYGYYIYANNVLLDAAQSAVRVAIRTDATDAMVSAEVAATMGAAGFGSKGYTITTTPASVANIATGTEVTVRVGCIWGNFGVSILPTSMGGVALNRELAKQVIMIRE